MAISPALLKKCPFSSITIKFMTILVTIGPTQEPLDAMRILSNRSTGALGTRLAVAFAQSGHRVVALRGTGSTANPLDLHHAGISIIPFTTTEELRQALKQTSKTEKIDAIFHAAAVSDFIFPDAGTGKMSTTLGSLTLTLEPTPKILPLLREWFPKAGIVGWKFEASGNKEEAFAAARAQITRCHTDGCILNGPSYGEGFGILGKDGSLEHLPDHEALTRFLLQRINAAVFTEFSCLIPE
jgi:phosphopantothenoylcysteine decarboxylase/phosphopantothenate--cysteine ligase